MFTFTHLQRLQGKGVAVRAVGGRLFLRDKGGTLSAEDRDTLQRDKEQVIALVVLHQAGRRIRLATLMADLEDARPESLEDLRDALRAGELAIAAFRDAFGRLPTHEEVWEALHGAKTPIGKE